MNQPRDFFERRPTEPPLSRWDIRYNAKNDVVLKKRDEDTKKESEKEKKTSRQLEPQKNEKDPNKKDDDKKPTTLEQNQEKRAEIIERSQAYKKQFKEAPIPNNSTTVAKLIIAEHILSLNEQLHTPEEVGKSKPKKELEEGLDYLCLLAEKFEDPTTESSPEIQLAYETLLEITEEALQGAESPEHATEGIVEIIASFKDLPPQTAIEMDENEIAQNLLHIATPPASPSSPPLPIIAFLSRLRNASKAPTTSPTATPPFLGSRSGQSTSAPASSYPPRIEKIPTSISAASPAYSSEHSDFNTHSSAPRAASEYHEAMQPRAALQPLAAIALASVIAAKIHKGPEISHRHEYTRPAKPNLGETQPKISASQPEAYPRPPVSAHSRSHTETFTSFQRDETHPNEAHLEAVAPTPSRKFEHMTTQTLLELAHSIPVGHGRYLAHEYEHGHIDRDGLIKVLKAKKKGFDISREYSVQAANLHLRRISPEFLRNPTATNHIKQDDESEEISDRKEPTSEAGLSQQAATSRDIPHPLLERFAQPEKSVFQTSPKNNATVQIIIGIAALIIVGLIILLLF